MVITYEQIVIMAVALAATVALAVFFRRFRLGLAMRAVVDDPTLLALNGTSPVAVRRAAWIAGSVFVCLSGVLLAPSVNLDSMVLTLLVVQSFGAAAIGRFSNLPLTYVGGLAHRGRVGSRVAVRQPVQPTPRRAEPERALPRAVRRPDPDPASEAGRPQRGDGPRAVDLAGAGQGPAWSAAWCCSRSW